MAQFSRVGGSYFRQADDGQLYAVSDPTTLSALKSGQLPYSSVGSTTGLKFASTSDINQSTGGRGLSFSSALPVADTPPAIQTPAPQSATGTTTPAPAAAPTDLASLLRQKFTDALTNYSGASNTSELEQKRQDLLRKQLLAPVYGDPKSEAVLTPDQKLSLLRARGSEYDPMIKSLESQITAAKNGDSNAMDTITKIATAAKSLGIDISGSNSTDYQSSIGKEYSDYVANEKANGNNKPLSLNDYMNMDANRKKSVTQNNIYTGTGAPGTLSPQAQAYMTGILNGTIPSIAQVPAEYKTEVAMGMANADKTSYSPLADRRFTMAANAIATPFMNLPQYALTANGLPYLQRIDAAIKTPGSISDQDLLDSLTKLNTAGNAISDAQVRIITDGKSFSDMISVAQNKFSTGGVLSTKQRTDLQTIAKAIFENYKKGYQPVYDQVIKQYQAAGIPEAFWTIPNLNDLSGQALTAQTIHVKRTSDGQTGTIDATEFNPSLYTKI